MTMTITCKTCNDTGWDDLFNSACGDCGAHLADIDVEAARAAFAESRVKEESLAAKRVALVAWLETQDWDFPLSLARQFKSKGDLSIKQWAAAERLHAKATDPAAPPRWAKVGDVWGVRVVGGSTGDTVTVTKAGKVQDVVLGEALGNDTFAPFEEKIDPLADGTYEVEEEDGTVVKYKVQTSQAGRQYAKRKSEGRGWDYVGREPLGMIAKQAKLTAEATAELQDLIDAFRSRFGIGKTASVALPTVSGTNDLGFWNVTKTKVWLTVGGQGRTPQPIRTQVAVLKRIAGMTDDEVAAAMVLYGQEIGACGRCGSSLTDKDSRDRGIGPECARKGF